MMRREAPNKAMTTAVVGALQGLLSSQLTVRRYTATGAARGIPSRYPWATASALNEADATKAATGARRHP
jgi:hypothetical protein